MAESFIFDFFYFALKFQVRFQLRSDWAVWACSELIAMIMSILHDYQIVLDEPFLDKMASNKI